MMPQKIIFRTQTALAWFALIAALMVVAVVLISYVVSARQPYRGPTLTYFYVMLLVALISRKWSVALLIFGLPLLPSLATQLEYVLRPSVKYFVAYPGLDAIVGLFVGQCVRSLLIDRNLSSWLKPPPWPLGLATLVITISCWMTIDRNLWQSAANFSWFGLANNIFRFKHVSQGNPFLPFNDFLVYAGAVLLIICLLQTLRDAQKKDELVFRPVVIGLIVSATWGLVQALSGFGMPAHAIEYRTNTFGYSAFGFQPDIHAFAGHMLVGAVGLFGYMWLLRYCSVENEKPSGLKASAIRVARSTVNDSRWPYLIFGAFVFSWVALFLSKSRATLIFAIVVLVLGLIIFLINKKNNRLRNLILLGCGGLFACLAVLSLGQKFWLADAIQEIQTSNLTNFQGLNRLSVYRLEMFAGALRMFYEFPLMGIGQGNFFHMSSVLAFMGSPWAAKAGGENAHNYFLQTLAELGLVGVVSIVLIFIWPFIKTLNRKALMPASIAIGAIFLGNLYSHSLIIRENLYLLAVFVALLYAHRMQSSQTAGAEICTEDARSDLRTNSRTTKGPLPVYVSYLLIGSIALTAIFAYKEMNAAMNRFPFANGSDCYRRSALFDDGWTSGQVLLPLPSEKTGLNIVIDQTQPDAKLRPLDITLSLVDQTGRVLHAVEYPNQAADQFSLKIELPAAVAQEKLLGISVGLKLSRCYLPSNFGLKDDTRRLGVHIQRVEAF